MAAVNDSLEKVLSDADDVARYLQLLIADVSTVACHRSDHGEVAFTLELRPWHALRGADPAFPVERVVVSIQPDGSISATPLDQPRSWVHRNMGLNRHTDLCLFYDQDPAGIRWSWDDGLACFVGIVHRHLIFEEWVRRGHPWPCEDAPHGRGDHPVRSPRMQVAAGLPIDLSAGAQP